MTDSERSESVHYDLVWDNTTVIVSGLARTPELALAAAVNAFSDAPELFHELPAPRELVIRLRGTR